MAPYSKPETSLKVESTSSYTFTIFTHALTFSLFLYGYRELKVRF